MNTTYVYRETAGLCRTCGIQPRVAGKTRCAQCAEHEAIKSKEARNQRSTKIKAYHNERARVKQAEYRLLHPEEAKATAIKSQLKLRMEVLSHYGKEGRPECVCCGENIFGLLTLGHIERGHGNEDRKTNGTRYNWLRRAGFPVGYQTECYNCNCGKEKNGGICPHQA